MIGGAGLGVIGIGVFVTLSRKHNKQQSMASATITAIGSGVQVSTGNVGTTKQEPNWNSPFDMNYLTDVQKWVAPKSIRVLDDASAKQLAKIIAEAKGAFNDDEDAVKDVFGKKLRDKTQVASLSKAFYQIITLLDVRHHYGGYLCFYWYFGLPLFWAFILDRCLLQCMYDSRWCWTHSTYAQ